MKGIIVDPTPNDALDAAEDLQRALRVLVTHVLLRALQDATDDTHRDDALYFLHSETGRVFANFAGISTARYLRVLAEGVPTFRRTSGLSREYRELLEREARDDYEDLGDEVLTMAATQTVLA